MKSSHFLLILTLLLLLTAVVSTSALAQADYPRISSVEPDTGSAGDVLIVAGKNLDKANVKELYITDGQTDWKTEILEQSAEAIKFKIPANVKTGRFNLMVLTAGKDPRLIEEPVKVNIQ